MVLTPDQLSAPHRTLAEIFATDLESALGENFAGLFVYGAACFRPAIAADFDYHVLLGRPLSDTDRTTIDELHERLEREVPLGDDMDGYYITLEAAAKPERPAHERHAGVLDWSWALHRAHVHGGRYVVISGADPRTIVPVPAWDELDDALQGELEFVTRHIEDGDSAAHSTLNLCRILYSYETRDVVASKYQGALLGARGTRSRSPRSDPDVHRGVPERHRPRPRAHPSSRG